MKMFDKLKNLLKPELDNEEDNNNNTASLKENQTVTYQSEPLTESEEYQFAETFKFPVVVEEDLLDDFEIEQPTKKVDPTPEYRPVKREAKSEPLTKKPFKPSPIISPVYGIIDNNDNNKIEDPVKSSILYQVIDNEKVTFDTIRQKAYGTLESEIESVINDGTDIFFDLEETEEDDSITIEFVKDQEDIGNLTIADAEDNYEYRGVATNTKIKPTPEEIQDLVDAMYDEEV